MAMHHGFLMNVRGISQAAELRRRSGQVYDYVIRLRPDGKDPSFDFGWKSYTAQLLGESLWNCIAHAATRATNQAVRERPTWAASNTVGWQHLVDHSINSCSPIGNLATPGQNGLKRDNCFWGTPAAMDKALAPFEHNYKEVYEAVSNSVRLREKHNMETMWNVAYGIAKVHSFAPCYPHFMAGTHNNTEASEDSLHHLMLGLEPYTVPIANRTRVALDAVLARLPPEHRVKHE